MTISANRPAEPPSRREHRKARRRQRAEERAAAALLPPAARWTLGLTGASALGAGSVAVFVTQVEAGPVALITVGAFLLLIAVMGRRIASMSLVDGGLQWEQRVEREMSAAESPDRALEVAAAATTVAPEVQRNEHISTMSHQAFEQVIRDRLVAAFGESAVAPAEPDHRRGGVGHDFVVTRGGKKVGVDIRFGNPTKTAIAGSMFDRMLRAFVMSPDLDALVFVSNSLPPMGHFMERQVGVARDQGKVFQYVRWNDDSDTPALRQTIEELL
ncbi:hypothetical protein [Streptomyces sp. NPDC056399]|uniref:hypothetical protein n=1 Tax=Streptomyces sp. NPDC056399 TaxID=3345807 RepID=UPI0035E16440